MTATKQTLSIEQTLILMRFKKPELFPHKRGGEPSKKGHLLCYGNCNIDKCKVAKSICLNCGYLECWFCGEDWASIIDELLIPLNMDGNGIYACRNCFSFNDDHYKELTDEEFEIIISKPIGKFRSDRIFNRCSKMGCIKSSRSEYGAMKKIRQCKNCQKEFCRHHFLVNFKFCGDCFKRRDEI